MKKRVIGFTLSTLLLALGLAVEAQQTTKIPRIGYVSGTGDANNPGPNIESFRQGLRDLSYVEGKNIVVEYRYAEGKNERLPGFVAELVKLQVDVVVVIALPAIRAAKKATQTIPIVMVTSQDPVATGLVDSLARPGGNITGLTRLTRELSGNGWNCFRRWSRHYHALESSGWWTALKPRSVL
jgi:putative tryptophan/tyrosine transport system substrate-binding protein